MSLPITEPFELPDDVRAAIEREKNILRESVGTAQFLILHPSELGNIHSTRAPLEFEDLNTRPVENGSYRARCRELFGADYWDRHW